MGDDKYYDPEKHGPMDYVDLDRRLCALRGGYLLCPNLAEDKKSCTFFREELRLIKDRITGLYSERTPIQVPLRCDACKESSMIVVLETAVLPSDEEEKT